MRGLRGDHQIHGAIAQRWLLGEVADVCDVGMLFGILQLRHAAVARDHQREMIRQSDRRLPTASGAIERDFPSRRQ